MYELEPESGEPEKAPDTQGLAAAAAQYQVRKRISGDYVDFAIFRRGDKTPYDVFEKEKESEAKSVCERLNASAIASPAAGSLAPPQADAQPASSGRPVFRSAPAALEGVRCRARWRGLEAAICGVI